MTSGQSTFHAHQQASFNHSIPFAAAFQQSAAMPLTNGAQSVGGEVHTTNGSAAAHIAPHNFYAFNMLNQINAGNGNASDATQNGMNDASASVVRQSSNGDSNQGNGKSSLSGAAVDGSNANGSASSSSSSSSSHQQAMFLQQQQQQHHHQQMLFHTANFVNVPSAFAGSFSHPLQHHAHAQQQQPSTLFDSSRSTTSFSAQHEDSSGEFEGSMCDEDENDEDILDMCDDPVMRERLLVVQQVQEQASREGASGIFNCPYCDKEYAGKHARSIWRRHLQDKHAIPLSQQPRRTRWDSDINRPKNAEERRQRMLESKRRWARKKRLMDKAAASTTGKTEDEISESEPSLPLQAVSTNGAAVVQEECEIIKPEPVQSVPNKAAHSRKRAGGSGNSSKPRGMQQLKFHHLTTTNMAHFVDASAAHNNGSITAVWNNANQKSGGGPSTHVDGSQMQARPFSKHASMPVMPVMPVMSQQMPSNNSPRRVWAAIDGNANGGKRANQPISKDLKVEEQQKQQQQQMQMQMQQQQLFQQQLMANQLMGAPSFIDPSTKAPMNRFDTLYPTPSMAGDEKSLAEQVFGGSKRARTASKAKPPRPLSPPPSQTIIGSSPSFMKRQQASSILSPVSSKRRIPHQSPNPFSLDQHKISPSTSVSTRARVGVGAPTSASRLSNALQDKDENRLSPLHVRRELTSEHEMNDAIASSASPVSKARKLPPLTQTPLRANGGVGDGAPTPSNGMSLLANGLNTASVRRMTRSSTAAAAGTPLKPQNSATPSRQQQERLDRLFGSSLGFTPFDARQGGGSKYSITRTGFYTRASPAKRDNGGGDQFSSPQHLNLTQSLGLAPHSTSKSASMLGGLNSLTGTPYVNAFLQNSPWPDSVRRPPSFKTSASKRGALAKSNGTGSADGADEPLKSSSDNEGEDDDDDDDGQAGIHETPSRPAKRPQSSLLGTHSPTTSQRTRSSVTRSQQYGSGEEKNGSSATRSRTAGRRTSDLPPPLSFKLSSPTSVGGANDEDVFDELEFKATKRRRIGTLAKTLSFDKELLEKDGARSPTASQSSTRTDKLDMQEEDSIDELI